MSRTTTSSRAAIRKLDQFVLYRSDEHYAIAPTICKTAEGDLVVGFRRTPNRKLQGRWNSHIDVEAHAVVIRSSDGGRTWSAPLEVHPQEGVSHQAAELTTLSDGRILLGSFQWAVIDVAQEQELGGPHLFTRSYHRKAPNNPWPGIFKMTGGIISHSDDGGRSFSPWRPVSVPEPYLEGLCAIEGKAVELPSGRILLPVYAATNQGQMYCALCLASDDRGQSFTLLSPVAQNPNRGGQGFDEHSFCLLQNGEVVSFLRATFDPQGAPWLGRSGDGGQTWDYRRLNGVKGFPVKGTRLSDGRVAMVYGHRFRPGTGVRMRLLESQCLDVEGAPEFVIRDDGVATDTPPDAFVNMDLGYPDAVEVAPGKVLVVYYMPDPVSGARIEATLLQV